MILVTKMLLSLELGGKVTSSRMKLSIELVSCVESEKKKIIIYGSSVKYLHHIKV